MYQSLKERMQNTVSKTLSCEAAVSFKQHLENPQIEPALRSQVVDLLASVPGIPDRLSFTSSEIDTILEFRDQMLQKWRAIRELSGDDGPIFEVSRGFTQPCFSSLHFSCPGPAAELVLRLCVSLQDALTTCSKKASVCTYRGEEGERGGDLILMGRPCRHSSGMSINVDPIELCGMRVCFYRSADCCAHMQMT